ncbi:MAG: hypothetical protein QOF74_1785, partial [Caballeronia mineralivorans]|nr:hypothetical protein [Caballeronia mineralivorans]
SDGHSLGSQAAYKPDPAFPPLLD